MKLLLSVFVLFVSAHVGVQAGPPILVAKVPPRHFNTIGEALAVANPDDTIEVGPGIYDESLNITKSLVAIKGAGPQHVLIRSPGNQNAFNVGDPNAPTSVSVTVSGLMITSLEGNGFSLRAGANLFLKNCVIVDCAESGVVYDHTGNEFVATRPELSAINCTFANNGNFAVNYRTHSGGRVRLDDCIFSRNSHRFPSETAQCNFTSATSTALLVEIGRSLAFGLALLRAENGYPLVIQGFTPIAANPLFVNSTNGNFTLLPGSPAINAGTPGLARLDPDGTTCNLGAFSGPESAPFWPYPVGGPLIKTLTLEPNAVAQGGKITVKATATTR